MLHKTASQISDPLRIGSFLADLLTLPIAQKLNPRDNTRITQLINREIKTNNQPVKQCPSIKK